ncbi:MAG: TonB-dependent receptor [Bacteroidetes bacterium]|nr:TonB-dependent receptor [Bacteroidota bacterium]
MKQICAVIALIVFSLTVSNSDVVGQNVETRLTGTVQDSTGKGLPDVLVTLYQSTDSAVVKSAITAEEGVYTFWAAANSNYFITINALGYQLFRTREIVLNSTDTIYSIPPVMLSTTGELALESVEIVGTKAFVEYAIDRIIVHPDALISNAGSTALDVLEKSPGVRVDMNGDISLKGKGGITVYIDDKPTYLSSADLAGLLRSMPAESIESIEIMTNPPAKYDAAGTGGIINIRLKRSKKTGINGGINVGYTQGRYPKSNNSANFNYRINRFNFYTNLGYTLHNTFQDLDINRAYYNTDASLSSTFFQNTFIKIENKSLTGKLGMDFYVNDKSTFGIVLSGFNSDLGNTSHNTAEVRDSLGALQSVVITDAPSIRNFKNGNINLNYDIKLDSTGKQLTFQADYLAYNSAMDQELLTKSYLPGNIFVGESNLVSTLPTILSIVSAKVDYMHPLKNGARFDAGVKSSLVDADNIADFQDEVDGELTPNYVFSNHFIYRENINAGYVNYSNAKNKLSYQLGLRFENTELSGNQLGNAVTPDSSFTRSLNNIFPTAYLQYQVDSIGKHILGFSYGRRIDRPNYQDLNPFTYPLDLFTLYEGNPFLEPTFSHNFELSHTYNNMITTTGLLSIVNDMINETIEQRDGIFYSRPGNISNQLSYGISINGMIPIKTWWTLQFYSELMHNEFSATLYGQNLVNNGTHWYIGPVNQFQIKDTWSFELSGSYQTKVYSGQFILIPSWTSRVGVSKKIMEKKGTIKLSVNDIFYTNQPGGDIQGLGNSTASWYSYLDTRTINISFSYRFNKGEGMQARSTTAPEEKSRVE